VVAKTKSVFSCQNCGAQSPKWIGRCPSCNEWNTYVEEILTVTPNLSTKSASVISGKALNLNEINSTTLSRINVGIEEFNRVLGGGIVPGSIILIGGEPGIGKSTLVLQLALGLPGKKILYASGEESLHQIKLRAERLKLHNSDCLFLNETSLENLLAYIENINPEILIVDSIQTLTTELIESSPGSVAQVRECTSALMKVAKQKNISIILIGHINKEGSLAGPKVLEHMVDTVIQFEGDTNNYYRILRAVKNRFGSTSEIGIFEMHGNGLTEVKNPSEQLISRTGEDISGTAISATVEGIRPFLIEIQSLVGSAAYGTPQRSSTGFDLRRLNMLLAVLEKRAGFRLITKDVFLNIAGGLKIDDPGTDLAVICAVLSSNLDVAIGHDCCFAGEVGLTGEIRAVSRLEQRVAEASKLGFSRIFVPRLNKDLNLTRTEIAIQKVSKVDEVFRAIFR
jgi:DNA repair protein RadA/Sms